MTGVQQILAIERGQIPATLALADGTIFHGYSIGAEGTTSGEVVFNTAMSGYQEVLTDPSYVYQMVTFTCPHIGNVGVNPEDAESDGIHATGVIVRECTEHYANYRAKTSLGHYLRQNSVVGIGGIDTRALVLHLRDNGSQMGVISTGACNPSDLVDQARGMPSMEGLDLASKVSTKKTYAWTQGIWTFGAGYKNYLSDDLSTRPHCVTYDFGVKRNILRLLIHHGFRVTVVPGHTTAAEALALAPDALFLSNGPGDPAEVKSAIKAIAELVGKKPMFGICLGHQLLGLALGAPTYKLKFGHRGGNHPVRDERTGMVQITVQNHGFATDPKKVPKGLNISQINLNDGTVEGFEVPDAKAFSAQYHPESSPGPRDAQHLFTRFRDLVSLEGKL